MAGQPLPFESGDLPNRAGSIKLAVIGDNGTGKRPQYDVADQMAAGHARTAARPHRGAATRTARGTGFAVASGLHLSKSIGWRELIVLGFVSSIGVTLALFFASATLGIGQALNETRAGALLSVTAGLCAFGAAWLLGVGRFVRDGGGNR